MIKIAVCDDSEFMRSETKNYLLKYSFQKNFEYDEESCWKKLQEVIEKEK